MDPITAAASATPTSPPAAPRASMASDFDTFLRLLTAQMRNQDPLNPTDSADYAVQLATFAGVEQQVRTNELLAAQTGASGLGELAPWVGREARAPMAVRFDGAPVSLHLSPPAGSDAATLVVTDGAAVEVARVAVAPTGGPAEWAGVTADGAPLPPGLYRFAVEGTRAGEPLGSVPAEAYALVEEARMEGGAAVLAFAGGIAVPASAVTALRSP